MDESETTRLRALCDATELPWRAVDVVDGGTVLGRGTAILRPHSRWLVRRVAEIDMGDGEECDTSHAALIVAAVNALPGLLDAAEQMQLARDIHADYVRASDENARRGAAAYLSMTERAERAERERDTAVATLETRTAEHALAVEHLAAVTADRDEMAARRDDALADYAAVNEYLGGIVRAWQRAGNDERRMADTFVSGLRRELEEARDSGRGEWWEACRGGNPAPLRTELAVLRRQLPPLVACVDALRAAATAAGWRDADATGETLVAWVRRGAMRECLAIEAPKVRALRTAVNALCNVRTLRATCAEGETWRAHVHDKDWTDARANALAVLNATGGE